MTLSRWNDVPFVETSVSKIVFDVLDKARSECKCAAIIGSPGVGKAGANHDVTARARISGKERERFIDLYGQGLLLSEIASRLGIALSCIRTEAGTFEAKGSATLSARRVYSLYERGLDDIDIAMECRQPLSMVHSVLSRHGVRFEAGGAPCPRHSAIKSDGHLTRATGGSEGSLPPHHRSTTFAARAAS